MDNDEFFCRCTICGVFVKLPEYIIEKESISNICPKCKNKIIFNKNDIEHDIISEYQLNRSELKQQPEPASKKDITSYPYVINNRALENSRDATKEAENVKSLLTIIGCFLRVLSTIIFIICVCAISHGGQDALIGLFGIISAFLLFFIGGVLLSYGKYLVKNAHSTNSICAILKQLNEDK